MANSNFLVPATELDSPSQMRRTRQKEVCSYHGKVLNGSSESKKREITLTLVLKYKCECKSYLVQKTPIIPNVYLAKASRTRATASPTHVWGQRCEGSKFQISPFQVTRSLWSKHIFLVPTTPNDSPFIHISWCKRSSFHSQDVLCDACAKFHISRTVRTADLAAAPDAICMH